MKYRKLGRSGLDVSLICLGTMTWGQQNTEAEGHEQMDYALDQGVNFWDTAELYSIPPNPQTAGSTERIIGSWFASRGKRGKVILASKVVLVPQRQGAWPPEPSAYPRGCRWQPEAPADRLYRSLSAALAGSPDDLGIEPDGVPVSEGR